MYRWLAGFYGYARWHEATAACPPAVRLDACETAFSPHSPVLLPSCPPVVYPSWQAGLLQLFGAD